VLREAKAVTSAPGESAQADGPACPICGCDLDESLARDICTCCDLQCCKTCKFEVFCSTEKRLGEAQGEGLTVKEAEEEEAEQISTATEAVSSAPTA
jgi:hypothetical protein